MTGKTHQIFGQELILGIAILSPVKTTFLGLEVIPILGIIGVSFGSLISDIDIESSTVGRKVKFIAHNIPHRSPVTHSWLIPFITIIFMFLLGFASTIDSVILTVLNSIIYGFLIGVCSHVFADLWNRKGEKIFWPLYNKSVHIACIKTGTGQESIWLFFISVIWWSYIIFKKIKNSSKMIINPGNISKIGIIFLSIFLLIFFIKSKKRIQKKKEKSSAINQRQENKVTVFLIGKVIIYKRNITDINICNKYENQIYQTYGNKIEVLSNKLSEKSDNINHYILFVLNANNQIAYKETSENSYHNLLNLTKIKVNKDIFKQEEV